MSQMKIIKNIPRKELVKMFLTEDGLYSDPDNENNTILNYFIFNSQNEWIKDGVFDFGKKKSIHCFLLGESEIELSVHAKTSPNIKYKMETFKIAVGDKVFHVDKNDVTVLKCSGR